MISTTMIIERGHGEGWHEVEVELAGVYMTYRRATETDPEDGGFLEDAEAFVEGEPYFDLTLDERKIAEDLLLAAAQERVDE